MCEDLERGTQEVDQIHEVSRSAAVGLSHAPFIVCQLDKFINLLVEFGVYLSLRTVTSVLKNDVFVSIWNKTKISTILNRSTCEKISM